MPTPVIPQIKSLDILRKQLNAAFVALAGGSGVTSVGSGTGLTGGPITTTGTLSFANIADARLLANFSGGAAAPAATTLTTALDSISSTQGAVLYRGAATWAALAPGTSGYVLSTAGPAADPTWAAGGSGVTSVATGAGLTGGPIIATGTVSFATIADQRILANVSGGVAVPTATDPSLLLGIGSALKWVTARTVTLGTDLTGNTSLDGSANVTLNATVAARAVTYAKIQTMAADRILGRTTGGPGDIEELTAGAGISLSGGAIASTITQYTDEMAQDAVGAMVDTTLVYVDGTPLLTRAALTGEVTATQGSNATTIANDAVTYAKMQNVTAASRLLGRGSAGGSGDVEEITIGSGLTLTGTSLSAAGGTASITQTEVDFGTTPVAEATFTITDAGVSPSSQLLASLAWEAPTGKDIDEVEMDDLYIICQPGTGDFQMRVKAIDGSYLADKFKINYLVG